VCELDAPRFIATFSGGNTAPVAVSVRAGNGATPPLIEALETLWTATEPRAPSRRIAWTTFAQQHAEPIARSGGVACYRIEGGDQVQQYLLTEAVASRVRDGACAIAALSDGTDLMRAMPRLERLSGVVPFVVAAADSGDFDRARVVWLGEKQTWTGWRSALTDGRSVCIVQDGEVPTHNVFYGEPGAVALLCDYPARWSW
jgi:hypothetical protein